MRIIVYSAIGMLLAGSFFFPQTKDLIEQNPDFAAYRIIAINIAFARMLIEGFVLRHKQRKTDQQLETLVELKSTNSDLIQDREEKIKTINELESSMTQLKQEHGSLQKQLNDETAEKKALKLANSDLTQKLNHLEIKTKNNITVQGEEAISFLSQLQQKGRFLDFIMDDVTSYSDAQVGAAARMVHQGCQTVMKECFHIEPVRDLQEGEAISIDKNEPASEYRLLGKVKDEPPYHGTLLHKGWATDKINLPKSQRFGETQKHVITPAEIEIM
ncbi:MAG: DUF2760 domain-containing protein [Bdellovibrionota bacterium]